jgi:hypothetical protein
MTKSRSPQYHLNLAENLHPRNLDECLGLTLSVLILNRNGEDELIQKAEEEKVVVKKL